MCVWKGERREGGGEGDLDTKTFFASSQNFGIEKNCCLKLSFS